MIAIIAEALIFLLMLVLFDVIVKLSKWFVRHLIDLKCLLNIYLWPWNLHLHPSTTPWALDSTNNRALSFLVLDLDLNKEMVKVFSNKRHFGGSLTRLALDLGDSSLIIYPFEFLVLYFDGKIPRILTKTDATVFDWVAPWTPVALLTILLLFAILTNGGFVTH